jgi:hypothetical protein
MVLLQNFPCFECNPDVLKKLELSVRASADPCGGRDTKITEYRERKRMAQFPIATL